MWRSPKGGQLEQVGQTGTFYFSGNHFSLAVGPFRFKIQQHFKSVKVNVHKQLRIFDRLPGDLKFCFSSAFVKTNESHMEVFGNQVSFTEA